MSKRPFLALALASLLVPGRPAIAQPPEPADAPQFSFPGAAENPASAVSAGSALAGVWLGDEPFSNPAAPARFVVALSPALVRMSRQDLRADNRNYDESPAFFDGAGAAFGAPIGRLSLWLYAHQPVLRREDNAFTRGTGTDPTVIPAALRSTSTARESRVGLAVSTPVGPVRAGVALDWCRRDDRYETVERSGSPNSGTRRLTFKGSGTGAQLGVRWERGEHWVVGAAARSLPALDLEGEQRLELLTGDSVATVRAHRESGWEGGVSARFRQSPAFSILAGTGGSTGPAWEGLGVDPGVWGTWRIGLEYHDPAEPWTVRFGTGWERQDGVPESRATLVGIGFGYDFDGVLIDVSALRRGLKRDDAPTSYDDRITATARVEL